MSAASEKDADFGVEEGLGRCQSVDLVVEIHVSIDLPKRRTEVRKNLRSSQNQKALQQRKIIGCCGMQSGDGMKMALVDRCLF